MPSSLAAAATLPNSLANWTARSLNLGSCLRLFPDSIEHSLSGQIYLMVVSGNRGSGHTGKSMKCCRL